MGADAASSSRPAAPATQAFFNAYGAGANINGPTLTRGDVSAIVGTGAGAFNILPAGLPVFGRVEKSLPIDAGGGDPQDHYQWVSRVDYNLGDNTQMYVRYAYAEPGSGARHERLEPLRRVRHRVRQQEPQPARLVHAGLRADVHRADQGGLEPAAQRPAAQRRPPADAVHESHDPGAPAGLSDRVPRLPAVEPGSAIPFGGPQKLLQFYQDQTWIKGNHDFRFGGSYVHIPDDRTFGAYANSVEALNTTSPALPSLDNFVLGQLARFQTAINPGGYPGGTYVTPVTLPSFFSANRYNEFALYANDNWRVGNRLTVNLGIRYQYFGPQTKSEPKYDSNFYYGDANASVNTQQPVEMISAHPDRRVLPTNESPVGTAVEVRLEQLGAARRLRVGRERRRQHERARRLRHGLRAQLRQRHLQRAVQPAGLPGGVDQRAASTCRRFRSTPIRGPVRRRGRRDQDDPARQPAPRRPEHRDGLRALLRAVVAARDRPDLVAKVEYTGSRGRKLYDLADPNKSGAALVYLGVGRPVRAADASVTRRSTRAATAASRSTTACTSRSSAAGRQHRACSSRARTPTAAPTTT